MNWRIVLSACLALAVLLGIRWLLPSDRSATPPLDLPDTRFDYTLSNYEARFQDADDQIELLLSGPRLEHVWAERVARLEGPRFHIEPEAADWRGRADHGRVLRDDEVLILEGAVELVHRHHDGDINVHAESLRYDRRTRTITSERPVRIDQAETWLEAGGLNIELDNNILELSNGVQGEVYAPPASAGRTDSPADSAAGSGAG